jgi:hypothetical protein
VVDYGCKVLLPNAGYLWLEQKMPSGTHFPSGEIHVTNQNLQDISGGMRWNMQHADNVRFLAVSGTMTIGTIRATYDFTLVVYEMHIDEVAWTIFSTLADALTEEFTDQFWQIVNHRRKDRRGFLDVPWIEAQQAYDVNAAYRAVRLSVFNNQGHTVRVTSPFIWNDTYLKVHPNGAAVFAEDKKFEFLLPWIITSHGLLPPKPVFWVSDERTIPLHRETLWLHENTIRWLSDTGEAYPSELYDEIFPRLQRLQNNTQTTPKGGTQVPKSGRWQERAPRNTDAQALPAPTPQEPQTSQPSQPTPSQLSDDERRYMALQAAVATLGQQTLAQSRENTSQPPAEPSATSSPPEGKLAATASAGNDPPVAVATAAVHTTSEAKAAEQSERQEQPAKVAAQTLADVRPIAPPAPPTSEPIEPKEGALDTSVLPSAIPNPPVTTPREEQPGVGQSPPADDRDQCKILTSPKARGLT